LDGNHSQRGGALTQWLHRHPGRIQILVNTEI
jgi:hypothetical protein